MMSEKPESKPSSAKKRIGVLINNFEGQYQTHIMAAVKDFTQSRHLQAVIFNGRSLDSPHPEEAWHNHIFGLCTLTGLDGLLVVTGSLGTNCTDAQLAAHLKSLGQMPIVTIGRLVDGFAGTRTENRSGILAAMHHLVADHGLRRIAFLSGPVNDPDSVDRMAAYRQGLEDHGLPFQPDLVWYGDYTFQSGSLVVRQMLRGGRLPFDAVMCANDEMALGLQRALEQAGFRVPHDVALVGFDNVAESAYSSPALSTVNQQLYEQTMTAGEMVLRRIQGSAEIPTVALSCQFIWRETCGCSMVPLVHARQAAPAPAVESPPGGRADANRVLADLLQASWLSPLARAELERIVPSLLDNLHLDLRSLRDPPLFLLGLNDWLEISFTWERYAEHWNAILNRLRGAVSAPRPDSREAQYLAAIFQEAHTLLARRVNQHHARQLADIQGMQSLVLELSMRLNESTSVPQIIACLRQQLPIMGITQAFLALSDQAGAAPEQEQDWLFLPLLGLEADPDGLRSQSRGAPAAPPEEWIARLDADGILYLPLVSHERLFGYIVLAGDTVTPITSTLLQQETAHAFYVAELFAERQRVEERQRLVIEEHRQSEERYREMAMMVPMLMWETDQALGVKYLNQAAADGLGLTVGESLRSLLVPEDRGLVDKLLNNGRLHDNLAHPGVRIRRTDGRGQLLVQQLSIIRIRETGAPGLRWHALDPLPLMMESTFPDQSFFDEYQISGRERQIMLLLVQGYRAREIGERFSIAESTVKGHISHIYDKFGVDSRTGLVDHLMRYQVRQHGYGAYLFMVLNQLLSSDSEPESP
jgi:DNA-binding LacI/PurR family transcriptional regulator/DNA-binding CsgD family transcriptional regulator/PAS domain-containing protein